MKLSESICYTARFGTASQLEKHLADNPQTAFRYYYRGRRVQVTTKPYNGLNTSTNPPTINYLEYAVETTLYEGCNPLDASTKFGPAAPSGHDNGAWQKRFWVWRQGLSGSFQGAGGVGGLLQVTGWVHPNHTATETWHYAYDGNGNVTELIARKADGALAIGAHYECDAFGLILSKLNPITYNYEYTACLSGIFPFAWTNPYRYSTKIADPFHCRNWEHGISWHYGIGGDDYVRQYCAPSEAWLFWQGGSACRSSLRGESPEGQGLTSQPYRVLHG
jgi:hypothetical protein